MTIVADLRPLLDDLQSDRARAGDDPLVVERRDDRGAGLLGDLAGDGVARRRGHAGLHDLRAVGLAWPRLSICTEFSGMTIVAGCRGACAARATPWA